MPVSCDYSSNASCDVNVEGEAFMNLVSTEMLDFDAIFN